MDRRRVSKPTILFAGGCHLEGYPVGREFAFPSLILRRLGNWRGRILLYQNLSSVSSMQEAYAREKPDVVVLQLGHYEIPYEFGKVLKPRVVRRMQRRLQPRQMTWTPNADQQFQKTLRWKTKAHARQVMAAGLKVLGRSLYNPDKIWRQLENQLMNVPGSLRPCTFLLSPFPCPDPYMRRCRVHSTRGFVMLAKKYGVHFVDVRPALMSEDWMQLFADPYHLNVEGQAVVTDILYQKIAAELRKGI